MSIVLFVLCLAAATPVHAASIAHQYDTAAFSGTFHGSQTFNNFAFFQNLGIIADTASSSVIQSISINGHATYSNHNSPDMVLRGYRNANYTDLIGAICSFNNGFSSPVIVDGWYTSTNRSAGTDDDCTIRPNIYYQLEWDVNLYSNATAYDIRGRTIDIYGDSFYIDNGGAATDIPNVGTIAFSIDDDSTPVFPDPNTDGTHIIYNVPDDEQTIATSTTATVGAEVNVTETDFSEGMYLRVKYVLQGKSQVAVADFNDVFTTIDIPIDSDGDFTYSTTTPILQGGRYTMITEIHQPDGILSNILNFFGLSSLAGSGVLDNKTTTFIAAAPNNFDDIMEQAGIQFGAAAASSTASFGACVPTGGFDVVTCIGLLFVPTAYDLANILERTKAQILSKMPWGYFTRFMTIITSTATSTVPMIDASVPISPTESIEVVFDEGDIIRGGGEILNSAKTPDNMSIQDIAEPWLRLFLALTVLGIIITDLLRMNHKQPHGT